MQIKPEVLDELLKDYKKPEDVIGESGLLKQLTKALLERALNTELTHHLGYEKHERATEKRGERAERGQREDAGDRARRDAGADSAGQERDIGAADRAQTPTAICGIR